MVKVINRLLEVNIKCNILLGKYYHTSSFGLTLTDQIWDMNYLALNCGGSITAGSDVMTTEQISITTANQITVSQEPKEFTPTSGIIGWYKLAKEDDSSYRKMTIDKTTKIANVGELPIGSIVCVKYIVHSASARKFVVNADYIPSVVHAVMTISLFRAGITKETLTSSSKIADIIVDIPNFQLEGAQELGLSSSTFASVSLNGSALATFDGNSGCSDHGYYAVISENPIGGDEFSNVKSISVSDSDITLTVSETQPIEIIKFYSDGTNASPIDDNSKVTFTSSSESIATVDNKGKVTAISTGETIIECVVTSKPNLVAKAVVTVD